MLPENLTIAHIAKAMEISPEEITALANNPRIAYATPKSEPHNGKMRLITKPRRAWKQKYRYLATFLRRSFPQHSAAHGSVPGRSPFTAGRKHCGYRHLVCLDVKDAFPSVIAARFYLEMLALGFSTDVARLLTKLLLPDGYIPQGGTTSNIALDLFMYRADEAITTKLSKLSARYTRFTDGLDASFPTNVNRDAVAFVIEDELRRLGLRVNLKKLEKNGWQPVGTERVMCGVCVNSPLGTQLPCATVDQLITGCESLYRGASSVAPHTLVGLARRRRSLQGWINQGSQADIAPIRDLQRRLRQADQLVAWALSKDDVRARRQWYTKGADFDEAAELAVIWRRARSQRASAAA